MGFVEIRWWRLARHGTPRRKGKPRERVRVGDNWSELIRGPKGRIVCLILINRDGTGVNSCVNGERERDGFTQNWLIKVIWGWRADRGIDGVPRTQATRRWSAVRQIWPRTKHAQDFGSELFDGSVSSSAFWQLWDWMWWPLGLARG